MAHTIPFDTLAFAKELETAGVPPAQAEAHAKVMAATIQKVEEFRLEELATKGDVELVKAELRKEIETAKVETIKWVVATGIVILGGVAAINRLLPPPTPVYVQAPEMRYMSPATPTPVPQAPAATIGK